MNIPDKALEAAERTAKEFHLRLDERDVTHILEAAAPSIAAQALRGASSAAYNIEDGSVIDIYRTDIAEWLDGRAREVENE